METYVHSISDAATVAIELRRGVFRPTATTTELIRRAAEHITVPGKTLDLGCGSGAVGVALYKMGKVSAPLCASDVSREAIDLLSINCERLGIPVDVRLGSLYSPWEGDIFDYVVDDVSGVAEEVAALSPWFDGVPCEAGADGTELVIKALAGAPKHLRQGGKFFFPILSLSNGAKIIKCATDIFSNVNLISTIHWPLPVEMKAHDRTLKSLRASGLIEFEEKFGLLIMSTRIYVAHMA
jgi:predicted RNA methylase